MLQAAAATLKQQQQQQQQSDVVLSSSLPRAMTSSRDDSGNSSSNSSLEQLQTSRTDAVNPPAAAAVASSSLSSSAAAAAAASPAAAEQQQQWQQQQSRDVTQQQTRSRSPPPVSVLSQSQDDWGRPWKSVDVLAGSNDGTDGYELSDSVNNIDGRDVHLPLHKTVCCVLCRKKEERQRKLLQQDMSWPTNCPHETSPTFHQKHSNGHHFHNNNNNNNDDITGDNNNTDCNIVQCQAPVDSNIISSSTPELNVTQQSPTDDPDSATINTQQQQQQQPSSPAVDFTASVNDLDSRYGSSPASATPARAGETVGSGGVLMRSKSVRHREADRRRSALPDFVAPMSSRRQSGIGVKSSQTSNLKPISDPRILQALQTTTTAVAVASNGLQISPKDEKLMALLIAKRQQEREQQLQRDLSHQQWEKEALRRSMSNPVQRRATTVGSQSQGRVDSGKRSVTRQRNRQTSEVDSEIQQTPPDHRTSFTQLVSTNGVCARHGATSCSCGRDHNKQVDISPQSKSTPCNCKQLDDGEHSDCCPKYAEHSERKQQKSNSQLQHAIERKAQVERRLEEQKIKSEKSIDDLKLKQEQEEERINAVKFEKQRQAAEKASVKSQQVRLTLEQARQQERETLEELTSLQQTIEANLTAAELKAKRLREQELARIRAELQRKIERSREKQLQMEEELKNWQESVAKYIEWQDKNARAIVEAQKAKKREAVAKERENKEKLQRENLMRMHEREKEWKESVRAAIESKETRSKTLQQEREAQKRQAREVAMVTRQMRDELRLN